MQQLKHIIFQNLLNEPRTLNNLIVPYGTKFEGRAN